MAMDEDRELQAARAEERRTARALQQMLRKWAYIMAAGLAIVAMAFWLARPGFLFRGAPVASLLGAAGLVEIREKRGAPWRPVSGRVELRAGSELRTSGDGRVALALADGTRLKIDADTQLGLRSSVQAALKRGGIYVESDRIMPTRAHLTVKTPLGAIRRLGTAYEVRWIDDSLRVGVREGRIVLRHQGRDIVCSAGEQLAVTGTAVVRSALSPDDPRWAWIGRITPRL